MRALVLSIDLDGPPEYAAVHGLPPAPASSLMYGGPLGRFAGLCEQLGAPGTIFVIGRDLGGPTSEILAGLAEQGHEIGDHSLGHDYHLSTRRPVEIAAELERSRGLLRRELGVAPRGFRAPGYHLSSALLDVLEDSGYRYDSSVLPSPPYYLAKLGVLLAYRLSGRVSGSLVGSPRIGLAPSQPYRPGRDPYRGRGRRRLIELPLAVATPARLPITGASLLLAPAPLRAQLLRALEAVEVVVINLHAMELVDPEVDGLARELVARQPELRVRLRERMRILVDAFSRLSKGRLVTTCERVAEGFGS